MNECYLCGVTEDKAVLYEGIHMSKGVIHICRKCYFKEKIPLIDKKDINLNRINSRESVRERLSRMAHVDVEKKEEKKIVPNQDDIQLKDLVERNFKKDVSNGPKSVEDLIDNFNWIIMRKRRSLKLSKEKVAEDLFEPLIVIESLEKGILPRDYQSIIKKLEGYLEINLRKEKGKIDHQDIINESRVPTGILISEVKKRAKEKEDEYVDISNLNLEKVNEIYGTPEEISKKDSQKEKKGLFHFGGKKEPEKVEENQKKEDLSDEDISKLVWGK